MTTDRDELRERLTEAMRDAGGDRAPLEDLAEATLEELDKIAKEDPTVLMRELGEEGSWFRAKD